MADILAWIVVVLTYVFGVIPVVGSLFANRFSSYVDCLVVGFTIHGVIGFIVGLIGLFFWAVNHLGWL